MIVQIAGVRNKQELNIIINSGATSIGFPLRLPVHKEDTSEQDAKALIKQIPSNIYKVLITYMDSSKEIIELATYLGTDMIQLHGEIKVSELATIKGKHPQIKIIKSLIVKQDNFSELKKTIAEFEDNVDFFITDTFDPDTGASGATGKTHDWEISKKIVKLSKKPVIIAGGLTPDNVGQAIKIIRPAGVDVHTGVENSLGEKEPALVNKFVIEANKNL
ncbi:MAG: phosphoribosylanthranilate isomerase [bacterium]